jgi:hypothetical protein
LPPGVADFKTSEEIRGKIIGMRSLNLAGSSLFSVGKEGDRGKYGTQELRKRTGESKDLFQRRPPNRERHALACALADEIISTECHPRI